MTFSTLLSAFSLCFYPARAPPDARLLPVLLKQAGYFDHNAGLVLAPSSLIVEQTACNGKAFFSVLIGNHWHCHRLRRGDVQLVGRPSPLHSLCGFLCRRVRSGVVESF
ncbi:hypothetical protein, unlikely [Trypanosoma congolense IL3000]|uniref:T. congolense-specific, cell surface-expressed gene family n=1 Tax=Trypanosoma congolense (strain IL3000) TaxID=1068625 RepID=F9W663_TRYCI|nr:hypothetical protein, unlikely [Trypanosoma congolense IL3000]